MKLVTKTPDPDAVRRYYRDMAEGKLPSSNVVMEGYGRLGRMVKRRGYGQIHFSGNGVKEPVVKLVTPTAMATEQAKARIMQGKKKTRRRRSKITKRKSKPQPIRKKLNGGGWRVKKQKTNIKRQGRKKTNHSASRRSRDNFSK